MLAAQETQKTCCCRRATSELAADVGAGRRRKNACGRKLRQLM